MIFAELLLSRVEMIVPQKPVNEIHMNFIDRFYNLYFVKNSFKQSACHGIKIGRSICLRKQIATHPRGDLKCHSKLLANFTLPIGTTSAFSKVSLMIFWSFVNEIIFE